MVSSEHYPSGFWPLTRVGLLEWLLTSGPGETKKRAFDIDSEFLPPCGEVGDFCEEVWRYPDLIRTPLALSLSLVPSHCALVSVITGFGSHFYDFFSFP